MSEFDSVRCPSLPSNYVTLAHLQERWLKEKQRKQQEKEKKENEEKEQYSVPQNLIVNGKNHSVKGWREVAKEPKLKEVKSSARVVEREVAKEPKLKEVKSCARVVEREVAKEPKLKEVKSSARVVEREVAKEPMLKEVKSCARVVEREVAKEPKLKEVKSSARVVEEGLDGIRGKMNRKMGHFGKRKARVERNGSRDMAKVSITYVSEKEKMSGENGGQVSCKGKCKDVEEVGTVCVVEVVGESNIDREIEGKKCGVVFWEKEHSWRKMGCAAGEVSEKRDSMEQSGRGRNGGKEKVLVDVNESINQKGRMVGTFSAYGDKEVRSGCTVEVIGESDVGRKSARQRCGVGYKGKKSSWGGMSDGVGEVSEKGDRVEQSGQESNGEKKVSIELKGKTNEKVRVGGALRAYGDKEVEEVANVCAVEVVEENKEDSEITGQEHRVGFRGKKHSWEKIGDRVGFRGMKLSWRKIGDRVGEASSKTDSPQQSGQECNAENEEVSVDLKEGTNEKVRLDGAFRAYGDKEVEEVANVCAVEVVEENKEDLEITGQEHRVGFRGKKHSREKISDRVGFRGKKLSWRKIGNQVGEVSGKAESPQQSGQECNAENEEVSVDLKEGSNEKVRLDGAFRAYGDKEVEEVANVCVVEVVEENKEDWEITGQERRVGFRGKKPSLEKIGDRVGFRGKKRSWRKIGDQVGEVSGKAGSPQQSGQECNGENEEVSVDLKEETNEKVRLDGAFRAHGDKEVEEVANVCAVEVVEENKEDWEITGQEHRVGFRGKKHSWEKIGNRVGIRGKKRSCRKIGDRVGEVSGKADSPQQSGQECNAENEEVSVDLKEGTNEKVRLDGAFRAYGDKEVEELAKVCAVEVVEENKEDWKITGQERRVGFREKQHSWEKIGDRVGFRGKKLSRRKIGDQVGEVSSKADTPQQSGQEYNAENEEVSVDLKEGTNEKVRVRGEFRAYSDKSIDVALLDSEACLKMKIESDLGNLSLCNRRHGHGRSSVGMYNDKRRYGNSRRYEPRKMLKQKDSSFMWIKKGLSSNANVAEIETQVDVSSQSTSQSNLCSQ